MEVARWATRRPHFSKHIMVLPEWQGRGVGLRIVEAMLAIIRRTAPDRMLVTLFTGQNLAEFYGKLGFCGPESGLYGMSLRIDRRDR
jgi:GNAT superfamily N-acetyltransferase